MAGLDSIQDAERTGTMMRSQIGRSDDSTSGDSGFMDLINGAGAHGEDESSPDDSR